MIDLHSHSNCSDGSLSPRQLVELALREGLDAIALTDHDTALGVPEALKAAAGTGLEVIPGIELSTDYHGTDVHVVGLYLNIHAEGFGKVLSDLADSRIERNRKMCRNLAAAGLDISWEKLTEKYPGAVITRANFATYLVEKGYVADVHDAFDRYLGEHTPYFVERVKPSPEQAVKTILQLGGIPVLAHPFQYKLGQEGLEKLVDTMQAAGLAAIEAYYSTHTKEQTEEILALAKKKCLLLSGGSDFHGEAKKHIRLGKGQGDLSVPDEILLALKHRHFGTSPETKIFFCDFDGTLGNSEKNISQQTREALDRFVSRGNIFVLSSGRATWDVIQLAKRLKLDYPDLYLSGYNGSEVYSCKQQASFFRDTLPLHAVKRVFEIAESVGLYCQTYDRDRIVVRSRTKETDYYTKGVKMPVEERQDPAALSEEPCKCLIIELDHTEKLQPCADQINREFAGIIHCMLSNDNYLEVIPVIASKGRTVRYLCRLLGIDLKNSIAAGDAPNDIPMLEAAGTGIAMINGSDAVKKAADIVTLTDNNNDGLASVLDRL